MIERTDKLIKISRSLEWFKVLDNNDFSDRQLYAEALDNIKTEIEVQKKKCMELKGLL